MNLRIDDVVTIINIVSAYAGKLGLVKRVYNSDDVKLYDVKMTDGEMVTFYEKDIMFEPLIDAASMEKMQAQIFDELIEPDLNNFVNAAADKDFLDRMYESGMMMPIGKE